MRGVWAPSTWLHISKLGSKAYYEMVSGLVLSVAKITQLWFSLCVCFKHKSLLMNVYFKTVNFHLVYLFKETNTSRLNGSLLLNSLMMRRRGYHMNKTLLWASPDCKSSITSKIPSSPSGLKSVQGSDCGANGCRIQPLFSLDLLFPAYKNYCGNITEISSSAASACHAGTSKHGAHCRDPQAHTGCWVHLHTTARTLFWNTSWYAKTTAPTQLKSAPPQPPIPQPTSSPGAAVLIQISCLSFQREFVWCYLEDILSGAAIRYPHSPSTMGFYLHWDLLVMPQSK